MVSFELDDESKAIQETARQFARKEIIPVAARHDLTMEYPHEIIKKAFEQGLLSYSAPQSVGGLGLSLLSQCLIQEEFAYGCTGIGTALGAIELALAPLILAGNPAQIEEFARPMTEKPTIAAYCVTEPGAGSDVASIRTTVKDDGGDHYLMNGSKMWITNASVSDWYFVLASMNPQLGPKAMCGFIIPAKLDGIVVGKKEVNLGQRCSDTRGITFENVKVPTGLDALNVL